MRTDARLGCNAGPGRMQSLRETPPSSRAEASNTKNKRTNRDQFRPQWCLQALTPTFPVTEGNFVSNIGNRIHPWLTGFSPRASKAVVLFFSVS